MGTYLNPGNAGFELISRSRYVDKTGMIRLVNDSIGTNHMLICVSRARRFGKSYAAQTLCAYYDKTCDSDELFQKYAISEDETYNKYRNCFDVIYLDMTNIIGKVEPSSLVDFIEQNISEEILMQYPDVKKGSSLDQTMIRCVEHTGNRFVMIIDEWDAPVRELPEIEKEYFRFLRMLFKGSSTTSRIFSAVYMTGILPIKKDGSQSAISDFIEYTMIKPGQFREYVGFTEDEVKLLCEDEGVDYSSMKRWYDGYRMKDGMSVYNPNSVMRALENKDFDSYWTETSAADRLMEYISMDYEGLSKTIAEMVGGIEVPVNTKGFANDLVTFRNKDDVLTLMIHLGYLGYDSDTGCAYVPNEEVRLEFARALSDVDHSETRKRLEDSHKLFLDTINGNESAVAASIERIHREETDPLHYNDEQALRSVIKLAYYTYKDNYVQWEELPSGDGYADVVYIPKQNSKYPALLIELKWGKSSSGAIRQILDNKYPSSLEGQVGEVMLVGINYDKETKVHTCKIVKHNLIN